MAKQIACLTGILEQKLKHVLWFEDLKASLRNCTEKIIHKSSSSKHTISLCCTLFKVWLLSLGAEYYIFVAKNAYFKLSELVSQISFTKSYYRESCSLLEIFMTVFEK